MNKALRILLVVLAVLLVLVISLLAPVDRTPYQETEYYSRTMFTLDSVAVVLTAQDGLDTVRIGWAEANITPEEPVDMTAYGMRGEYQSVHDSAMVRAIVFSNGSRTVAFLTYDLWMIHPHLAGRIRETMRQSGLPLDGIYLSATHTHNGYGGWAPGLAGRLIAGEYEEEVVSLITARTIEAIRQAHASAKVGAIGFDRYNAAPMVRNRLIENGEVDPWLRTLKMRHISSGATALLSTFSAHSTFMSSKEKKLASDWPAPLLESLEQIDSIDFAAYACGAVGSHAPVEEGQFSYGALERYGDSLASHIMAGEDTIVTAPAQVLRYAELPVAIREPHIRIAEDLRLRPWVFNALMGEQHPRINCLRVGNVVFLGLPGELSGEFYPRFQQICEERGLHLILTTFNGDYLGYITPDEYYSLNKYETRDMNWFGPYNGAYFTELILGILKVI